MRNILGKLIDEKRKKVGGEIQFCRVSRVQGVPVAALLYR